MKVFYKEILLLFLFFNLAALAQEPTTTTTTTTSSNQRNIRINVYGNYVFDDKFDAYSDNGKYYNGTLKGGFQGGIGIDLQAGPNKHIELLYLRQETTAPIHFYNNISTRDINSDVTVSYIMLGGTNSFRKPGSQVEGFGGLMLGVGIVDASSDVGSGSSTKFAWGLRAGGIIWTASERVGIKLQGQLLSISQGIGGGFYFGTGGAGAGVSSYSSIYQFTLGGGLVFALGK
jgi:hypothetical protein